MTRTLPACALTACVVAAAAARADDAPGKEIPIREALVIRSGGPGRAARVAVRVDPVAAQVVAGDYAPKEGDTLTLPDGSKAVWKRDKAGDDGTFAQGGPGSYVCATVPSETDRVMILEASGHGDAWVNGEPHAGDPYGYGYVKTPVKLRKGDNTLLFRGGRGRLRAKLVAPRDPIQLEPADATLPDAVAGRTSDFETFASVVLINASESVLSGAKIWTMINRGAPTASAVPDLLPLSARKVAVRVVIPPLPADAKGPLRLTFYSGGPTPGPRRATDIVNTELRVRAPGQAHKRTFQSGIDGSVQYYGVVPAAADGAAKGETPGLILTLHGASVEGSGQADVYAPKSWAHVVAPTNRRPYGFDWEDWGRLDAIEVLELAARELGTDPQKTWLTGHSMGGHGTWHLGVTFPDRFAAIAPSAGWVSMASYAGARAPEPTSPVAALLRRPTLPSDTLVLAPNLRALGVYVLHGDADDNVPVGQARTMRTELAKSHPDFSYYERPGAGHWWGNECCDWLPLMEFLKRHTLPKPEEVRSVDFTTASPGVSDRCHWAAVEDQLEPFQPSHLRLRFDPERRRFSGTTENVARLALDVRHVKADGPITVELDGQTFADLKRPATKPKLWFRREGKTWAVAEAPDAAVKNPRRYGPFKEAFRNRFVLVYGTKGNAEETAANLARARFDAERFAYQGNGSMDVVADTAFDPKAEPDRNVILYGHKSSHASWDALLAGSPVVVDRGKLTVGDRTISGENLAALFLRPRPGSEVASVGVVAGTGLPGLKLTATLPYMTSGVAYPDWVVLDTDVLTRGAEGVRGAGFFGPDWAIAPGRSAWRD